MIPLGYVEPYPTSYAKPPFWFFILALVATGVYWAYLVRQSRRKKRERDSRTPADSL